ncbi:transposase family protein [Streptomyces profundus]|uniref:transposase family protein n=1 Tax=Streptomyces profundus TaxID=2867410 RepID=UPI001D15F6E6|nr:transposase family protein [Streptomyces sp. MA3_2.13]UED82765.1 hypothetical protein K4G22_00030 [Streptomyces sp. MA3_2.13]
MDGTLISCDRVAGLRENGNGLWYSGTARRFAGNIPSRAAPDGTPLGISEVEPASIPDITAARIHALPALYKAATDGLPSLAGLGYQGAGIGIHTPTHDRLLRGLRALGERAAAHLEQRWRVLQHVTLSPAHIGAITQAALVLDRASGLLFASQPAGRWLARRRRPFG